MMNPLSLYLLELSVPTFLGLAVCAHLRGVTSRLLLEQCGTPQRADFWVRVSSVLILAAPVSLVLVFGRAAPMGLPPGDVLRHAMALSCVGLVIAVGILARTIMKTIPQEARIAAESAEAAAAV